MTNLFTPVDGDIVYTTVQDVKDSLGSPISLLSNEEIEKLIMRSQDVIDLYLNSINYDFNFTLDCVPIQIQRATVLSVRDIYNFDLTPTVTTMSPGDIVREKSCETEIEYFTGNGETINPCLNVSCEIQNLLDCFRVVGKKIPLMGCCPSYCGSCTNNCK